MKDEEKVEERDSLDENRQPLQFGISTLLWLMVAVGVIFGTLRWMRVSAITSIVVMAILAVCGVVVVLLVYAISKVDEEDR
jgi:hypothetical protein